MAVTAAMGYGGDSCTALHFDNAGVDGMENGLQRWPRGGGELASPPQQRRCAAELFTRGGCRRVPQLYRSCIAFLWGKNRIDSKEEE